MIRFRVPQGVPAPLAASCQHAQLARLADCGPWIAREESGCLLLVHATAAGVADWSPWSAGLGGLEYSVASILPDHPDQSWLRPDDGLSVPVTLVCGLRVAIRPASFDGLAIGFDGQLGGPSGSYARAVAGIMDRIDAGDDLLPNDPQTIAVVRLALGTGLRMPPELMHAWGLITTGDVVRVVQAAISIPKAEPDAGDCNAVPPASTSTASASGK